MNTPEQEVERLVQIVDDGVRRKMMRPKCLAKKTWVGESTRSLLLSLSDEARELSKAHEAIRLILTPDIEEFDRPAFRKLLLAVSDETYDLAAYGAMLEDPLRTGFEPRKVA